MKIVQELERPGCVVFEVDPSRTDLSCVPQEWTMGKKLQARYFNDWFDLQNGAGEAALETTRKWIDGCLKPGYTVDYNRLGMNDEDEDENVTPLCACCHKRDPKIVCAWCNAEVYCSQKCREKHRAQPEHISPIGPGLPARCPGPGGYSRPTAVNDGHGETEHVRAMVGRLTTELREGLIDIEETEDLIERMQSDDYIARTCEVEIQLLSTLVDQMSQQPLPFDPNHVLDPNYDDDYDDDYNNDLIR